MGGNTSVHLFDDDLSYYTTQRHIERAHQRRLRRERRELREREKLRKKQERSQKDPQGVLGTIRWIFSFIFAGSAASANIRTEENEKDHVGEKKASSSSSSSSTPPSKTKEHEKYKKHAKNKNISWPYNPHHFPGPHAHAPMQEIESHLRTSLQRTTTAIHPDPAPPHPPSSIVSKTSIPFSNSPFYSECGLVRVKLSDSLGGGWTMVDRAELEPRL